MHGWSKIDPPQWGFFLNKLLLSVHSNNSDHVTLLIDTNWEIANLLLLMVGVKGMWGHQMGA